MPARTILQKGSPCSDLFVYCHIEGSYISPRVKEVTTDAFVTELRGAGTSAYRNLIAGAGGWGGYVNGLATAIGHTFKRSCLITWSAGSQCAIEAVVGAVTPDAIVMMDGLYGSKPPGSKMGDGKVAWTPALEALAGYAIQAAKGEKILVIFHSNIATTYASSKECVEAVQSWVEQRMGKMDPLALSASLIDNHGCKEAFQLGNLRIVEFAGRDAKEHIAEAHLWDEACQLWVPWLGDTGSCDLIPSTPAQSPSPTRPIERDLQLAKPMLQGDDVKEWQRFLVNQGVDVGTDGVFGPKTEAATRIWQTAYNLTPTGIVGRETRTVAISAGMRSSPSSVQAITAPVPPGMAPLAQAVLAAALGDLADGTSEDIGHNDGKRIREMFKTAGGGSGNWCAAAATTWIKEGAHSIGREAPVKGSAGAKACMAQFQAAKRFYSRAELLKNPSLLDVGMIVFWDRSVPGNPLSEWFGHIGVCERIGDGFNFGTVEGNSGHDGARVAQMQRTINDPKFLGAGWLD